MFAKVSLHNPSTRENQTCTIQNAGREDIPQVIAMVREAGLPEKGLESIAATTILARSGDCVNGTAALELFGRQALLRSVSVAENCRGQGLGGALVRQAIAMAREIGVAELYLLTETAAEFFPAFGFVRLPREEISGPIVESAEFTELCPSTAVAMRLELVGDR